MPCWPSPRRPASTGTSSPQASRSRTPSSRASTAVCVTSYETLFFNIDDARTKVAVWVADYNGERPHSSLQYLTPAAYAATLTATGARLRNPAKLRRSPVVPTRAKWRTKPRGSNRRWMKIRWRVIGTVGWNFDWARRGKFRPRCPFGTSARSVGFEFGTIPVELHFEQQLRSAERAKSKPSNKEISRPTPEKIIIVTKGSIELAVSAIRRISALICCLQSCRDEEGSGATPPMDNLINTGA